VISTLDGDFFAERIGEALQNRKEQQAVAHSDYIEMSSSMFELIQGSHYQAKCKYPHHC